MKGNDKMKVNRKQNYYERTIDEFQKGDAFIDPNTDDVMLMTDMSTGDGGSVLAVSLYWGTMQEYSKDEIVYDCIAEVNVIMK